MAFIDLNGDGKNDEFDDFLEFKISEDLSRNQENNTRFNQYNRYNRYNSQKTPKAAIIIAVILLLYAIGTIMQSCEKMNRRSSTYQYSGSGSSGYSSGITTAGP